MKFVDFKKSLSNINPVYILCGKERYLIENALNNLTFACNVQIPELNLVYVDSSTPIEQILVQCETLPFCSDKRMIIAKDYPIDEKTLTAIKEYLNDANNTTCLVFTCEKVFESEQITIVDCSEISNETLKGKILSDLKKLEFQIQPDALELLVNNVNGSITYAYSELEKLKAIASNSKIITKEDVNNVCQKLDTDFQIYELTEAIVSKDSDKAITLLTRLIEAENKGIVSFLYNYFRRLFVCLACKDKDDEILAKLFKVKSYAIKHSRQQAFSLGAKKLLNCIERLEKIDATTKSTFANLNHELYLFLFYTLS